MKVEEGSLVISLADRQALYRATELRAHLNAHIIAAGTTALGNLRIIANNGWEAQIKFKKPLKKEDKLYDPIFLFKGSLVSFENKKYIQGLSGISFLTEYPGYYKVPNESFSGFRDNPEISPAPSFGVAFEDLYSSQGVEGCRKYRVLDGFIYKPVVKGNIFRRLLDRKHCGEWLFFKECDHES